jgi:hypothetical protein
MTDSPLPSGKGYHWSARQRELADDAVLDAREAWRESENQPPPPPLPDTSDLPPWSQACPGVPVVSRQAQLDQITACHRDVDDGGTAD